MIGVDLLAKNFELGELDFAVVESYCERGVSASLGLVDQAFDTAFGKTGGEDAVERARVATLLEVAEDRLPDIEEIAPLFLEERNHELGVVTGVGPLIANHQAEAFSVPEAFDEVLDVVLEVGNGHPLLVEIDPLGATREACHQGEVSAVPAHDFNHKTTPRGNRRLFDLVDRLDDGVEGGVRADREFRTREVIVDGRRHADDGDFEGWKRVALAGETERRVVAGPAADHQDAVNFLVFDITSDGVEVLAARDRAVNTEFTTTCGGPAADAHPSEFFDIAVDQALKAAADAEHLVALIESESHGGAGGGVHPRGGSARRKDREAQPALTRIGWVGQRPQQGLQCVDIVRKATASQPKGLVGVLADDCGIDLSGGFDTLGKRPPGDPVVPNANQLRCRIRAGCEHLVNRGVPEQRAHQAIVSRRGPTALDVTEDRDPNLLLHPLLEHLSDALGGDRLPVAVNRTFGDDDDAVAASGLATGAQSPREDFGPRATGRRRFRDEDSVGAGREAAHQGQISAMAAHDLDHEAALVAGRGGPDTVDCLGDPVERGVGADRHVRSRHIVVDRGADAGEGELSVPLGRSIRNAALLLELLDQPGPLTMQEIGGGQTAVATHHDQSVDAVLDEILCGAKPTFPFAELVAAGGANDGATLVHDAACRIPVHRSEGVAAFDQPPVPFADGHGLHALFEGRPDRCAQGCVHSGRVAATGQDSESVCSLVMVVHQ